MPTPSSFIAVVGQGSTSYVQGTVGVGTSEMEAKVGSARLSNRASLAIHNISSNTVYFGPSGVTTTTGSPLEKGERYWTDDANLAIYLIAGSASNRVVIEEKN